MQTERVYASPDGGGTDDMAAHVRGWQQLAEQRGTDLAAAREANDALQSNLTALSERLEALEAQSVSGEPEPAPFIANNNPPRRTFTPPPEPETAKGIYDSLRDLDWPEELKNVMVRRR